MKNFFKPFLDVIEQALKTGKKQPPANYGDMIIINPQGQFLILERANSDDFENNQWCLPGGHIESGESPVVAAHREAQEESNLEIDFETVEYIQEKNLPDGGKISYFVCSVDTPGDKVVLDTQEHQNYAWILPEQITEYDFIFDLGDLLCEIFDVKKVEVDTDVLNTEERLVDITSVLNKALDESQIDDDTYIQRLNQIQSIEKRYKQDVVKGFREKKISEEVSDDNDENESNIDMKQQYKDYIANSFIYQGKLYDKDGIGIAVTPEEVKQYSKNGTVFNADLYDEVEQKTTLKPLDPKRERFEEILPVIKRYDEYYTRYENELANQYNSSQNNFKQRRQELQKIVAETPDILSVLSAVKREFQDNIDPLFTVQFEDKPSRIAFLTELEDYIQRKPDNKIKAVKIRDLEDFDEGEFRVEQFKFGDIDNIVTIQKKAAEKLQRSKRIGDKLSKALDLELITEDEYLEVCTLLKADSSERFEGDLDAVTLKNDEGKEQDYSEAQLREHAKNTPLTQLESVIKESDSAILRELAHQEIKRREKEEHIQEEEIEKGEVLKGCTMYYPSINKEVWNEKLKDLIPENIVVEYETDPHITILYGHDHENTDVEKLQEVLTKAINDTPVDFNVDLISLFENENDVVKIGVQSESLTKLNALVREQFPYSSDFPDYKPHITLAYVKKGKGKEFEGQEINLQEWGLEKTQAGKILYSSPEKEKTLII